MGHGTSVLINYMGYYSACYTTTPTTPTTPTTTATPNHFPKVTVLLPVYNGEQYLQEALTSIATQTYAGPIDILIVNDGSTDRSLEILNTFASSLKPTVVPSPSSPLPTVTDPAILYHALQKSQHLETAKAARSVELNTQLPEVTDPYILHIIKQNKKQEERQQEQQQKDAAAAATAAASATTAMPRKAPPRTVTILSNETNVGLSKALDIGLDAVAKKGDSKYIADRKSVV
jgi:glycosyltransferase involved in cell wall biosynthesis